MAVRGRERERLVAIAEEQLDGALEARHVHAFPPQALAFDEDAARMYGRVFAAVRAAGRATRPRLADFLIASTAAARGLPLYTRNPEDLEGMEGLVIVEPV